MKHRIRESVACKITKLGHVNSEDNLADIMTKGLNGQKLHSITKRLLFRMTDSGECQSTIDTTVNRAVRV